MNYTQEEIAKSMFQDFKQVDCMSNISVDDTLVAHSSIKGTVKDGEISATITLNFESKINSNLLFIVIIQVKGLVHSCNIWVQVKNSITNIKHSGLLFPKSHLSRYISQLVMNSSALTPFFRDSNSAHKVINIFNNGQDKNYEVMSDNQFNDNLNLIHEQRNILNVSLKEYFIDLFKHQMLMEVL